MKKTTTEAELREWVAQGKTHAEIAALVQRNRTAVAATCQVLGIKPAARREQRRKSSHIDLPSVMAALQAGATLTQMAARHGVEYPTLYHALRRSGLWRVRGQES